MTAAVAEPTIQIENIKTDKYANKVTPLTKNENEALTDSLKKRGYLPDYPIIINTNYDVLDGHHRLKACKELGIEPKFAIRPSDNEIEEELFVIDINIARRQLSDYQRGVLLLKKKPILTEQAKRNMSLGGKGDKTLSPLGRVNKKLAEEFGRSYEQLRKIETLEERAPEDLKKQLMSGDKKISAAYSELQRAEDRDKPKPAPPTGQYEVLLIDPPWTYEIPGRATPENHYATMTDDEIMALYIPAAENAVLFLWSTNPQLDVAIDVMRAWGFEYKTNMSWHKDKFGTGFYFRGQHELLLLGVKGKGIGVPAEADRPSSVLVAPRTEHSKKPPEVYEMIEKMYPGRTRIEMFARGEPRKGWKTWGLEATVTEAERAAATEAEKEEDPDLKRFRKFGRHAFQNEAPRLYNNWAFRLCDPRLGQKHDGQIPGQIAQSVLYYYTKEGDLVIDPFAGGGSTIDVCKKFAEGSRRCLAYDVKPMMEDIKKWDVRNGFPEETTNCDLVFLDPPYWDLKKEEYSKDSISSLPLDEFLKVMKLVAKESYLALKPGGHVAFVMEGIMDEKWEYFIDLPFKCLEYFEKAGFTQVQRIGVPMPTQVKPAWAVTKANKEKVMLTINRDLLIFRKEKEERAPGTVTTTAGDET
jgi:N6-adenosine-specific RNA methylase IME4